MEIRNITIRFNLDDEYDRAIYEKLNKCNNKNKVSKLALEKFFEVDMAKIYNKEVK